MTESTWQDMTLLLLCWLGYFALHSTLASLRVKHKIAELRPGLMPIYRLSFNMLSVLLLLPILWLMYRAPGPTLWRWEGAAAWLANGMALAALLGFLRTLKDYDMQEFIGLRQWQLHTRRVEDQEHFHLSPFHRFVRHPWYSFGLILIWTRDMNASMLLSSVVMTLYFMIGSRLEEKKLLVYHGDVYRRYMARVPGLLPLPWKSLSMAEAAELVQKRAEHPVDASENT
jgi:protein-S-isoprenylcysteine O-methyltransferase Ste14